MRNFLNFKHKKAYNGPPLTKPFDHSRKYKQALCSIMVHLWHMPISLSRNNKQSEVLNAKYAITMFLSSHLFSKI